MHLSILAVCLTIADRTFARSLIAIALLQAGLNQANFHIDGVDISQKCLLAVQRGIYQKSSFRGNSLSFQERYFQPTEAGYHLCEVVRNSVHFRQGNLADADFLVAKAPYDIDFI